MSKFVKNLEEFLSLDYKLEIIPFEEEGEKGFVIKSPEINGLEVYGETIEEALEEVVEAKKALYKIFTIKKIPIKYPQKYRSDIERFSGRLTIRIPKNLHRDITEFSNHNNVSLNTGIIQLLNDGLKQRHYDSMKEEILAKISNMNKENHFVVNFEDINREIRYTPTTERSKSYEKRTRFNFIESVFAHEGEGLTWMKN